MKEHAARPKSIRKPSQDFALAEKKNRSKMETFWQVSAKLAVNSPRAAVKKTSDMNAPIKTRPKQIYKVPRSFRV